ncbi:MAG: DoxX family protein [Sphingopyxis sp.]|nr:DoxX family protein [Sphingopyxis sp.]
MLTKPYGRMVRFVSGHIPEAAVLLLVRISLAGVFWRAGRTKVEENSWLTVSETTLYQFADDPFNKLPLLPPALAANLTTYAEHLFPALLVLGLFTRVSAAALLVMTIVIQLFIFPDAWWGVHSLWAALALVLIVRGGGIFAADAALAGLRR